MKYRRLNLLALGGYLMTSIGVGIAQPVTPSFPLTPCCDNGSNSGSLCSGDMSHIDPAIACNEHNVSGYTCVDHTRDGQLCPGNVGTKYCSEPGQNGYPRYYALLNPIGVSPASLCFYAYQGGSNPASQSLSITNTVYSLVPEDYDLSWSASETLDWLSLSATSGHAYYSTPSSTSVSVNIARKAAGTYGGNITFSSSMVSSRQNASVSATLTIATPFSITITGSTELEVDETGSWTAGVSGGFTPYHYQWYYRLVCDMLQNRPQPLKPPCGYWFTVGGDNPSWSHADNQDFEVKCDVADALGTVKTSNVIYVTVIGGLGKQSIARNTASAVEADNAPSVFSFPDAYPNPFNPSTTLVYGIPKSGFVKLAVVDMLGREVIVLYQGVREAGSYRQRWNGTNSAGGTVAGGLYFAHLAVTDAANKCVYTKLNKLLLIK